MIFIYSTLISTYMITRCINASFLYVIYRSIVNYYRLCLKSLWNILINLKHFINRSNVWEFMRACFRKRFDRIYFHFKQIFKLINNLTIWCKDFKQRFFVIVIKKFIIKPSKSDENLLLLLFKIFTIFLINIYLT